jgi:inner membrane transporter RhtA
MPAAGLVIVAVLGFQLGAVVAKPAIEDAGPLHTTFLRAALGALMLLAWKRPAAIPRGGMLRLVIATGATLVLNSLFMYAAIERIPIGIAIAIGFWGPMALALHGSRRPIDYLWVLLAIAGILLFTPLADASFDSTGVILAVLAGAGFAVTLVCASKLGQAVGAVPAAGMATLVAAVMVAPFSLGGGLHEHMEAGFLGRMLLVAVLISIFGFAIEYEALTRVRPSLYAILISLEPAVGAVLGFLILGETIGWLGAAGIGAVSAASIGASRTHQRGGT